MAWQHCRNGVAHSQFEHRGSRLIVLRNDTYETESLLWQVDLFQCLFAASLQINPRPLVPTDYVQRRRNKIALTFVLRILVKQPLSNVSQYNSSLSIKMSFSGIKCSVIRQAKPPVADDFYLLLCQQINVRQLRKSIRQTLGFLSPSIS